MEKMKMKSLMILALAVLVAVLLTNPVAAADKPNVVLMLADNVGWGDIGAFGGGEIRGMPTPDQRSSGLSGRQVGDRSLRRRDHGARPE